MKVPKTIDRFGYENADSLISNKTTTIISPSSPAATSKVSQTRTYDTWGYPLNIVDKLGNETTYEYGGPFHQISSKTMRAEDESVVLEELYTYFASNDSDPNKRNQLSKVERKQTYDHPTISATQQHDSIVTNYTSYNSDRRALQTTESGTGDQFGLTSSITQRDYTYNAKGQVLTSSTQITLGEALSPVEISLTYEYDTFGRLVSTEYPDHTKVLNDSFDTWNRLLTQTLVPIGADNRTTSIAYDDNLRKVTVTLPSQEKQISIYSPFGQQVQSIQSVLDSTYAAQSRILSKTIFDPNSRAIVTSRPYDNSSNQTISVYDSFGRLTSVTEPLGKTSVYSYANVARNITTGMETLQNVVKSVEADGKVQLSFYDPYGRLLNTIVKSPNDLKKRSSSNGYNTIGQSTYNTINSGSVTQTTYYKYDGWGNLLYVKDNEG